MTFKPDPDAGLELWVDADFVGNWDKEECEDDPDHVMGM
jgi:hypothetical protein